MLWQYKVSFEIYFEIFTNLVAYNGFQVDRLILLVLNCFRMRSVAGDAEVWNRRAQSKVQGRNSLWHSPPWSGLLVQHPHFVWSAVSLRSYSARVWKTRPRHHVKAWAVWMASSLQLNVQLIVVYLTEGAPCPNVGRDGHRMLQIRWGILF